MVVEEVKRHVEAISGVSNVNYDVLAVLYNKLEGIAALEEYKADADEVGNAEASALFGNLQRREADDVTLLKTYLREHLT